MFEIEFYGVPRLRAARAGMWVHAATLGDAPRELGRLCPSLEHSVVERGRVQPAYQLSLNADRFISDPGLLDPGFGA
jgi:hypothetical protein